MKLANFLNQVELRSGYCSRTMATQLIEKMSREEFEALCKEMKRKDVPPVTNIRIVSEISGNVNIMFDDPDIFEKAIKAYLKVIGDMVTPKQETA